jgi:3-phenylpropionate/cinnamic acid dioxygenase small subunit
VHELLDFHQVSQALYRYASCVDKKDWTTLRTLFTDDATAKYGDYPLLEGGDAIVAFVAGASEKRSWLHHLVSVYHVDVEGDEASALTYHTSHQIEEADPESVGVIVARYHDRLRRVDGAWKIVTKEMEIGWRERRPADSVRQR